MKYYHVIYNSSERPMDGGVGLGIRTATEGIPAELLKAVKAIKIFTDDWESYENKPTVEQVKSNPASIEDIARNYAITNIVSESGSIYYVIARRAYVGFDYGFYKNGLPTRLGNYVIDYYIFDRIPDSSVYEILYEKPLPDSNHFIPQSVQPTQGNEEMKSISVGLQPALPVIERAFSAEKEDRLDKDAVLLFFLYLQSKRKGKKLVIKSSPEKALKLTADFYRMLKPELAKDIRTYVNLRSQGTNDSFDIFFIHDDYPHQIYDNLCDYVELEKAVMPNTDEARAFSEKLEALVVDSFSDNKLDIDDILGWLLKPEYLMVKGLDSEINDLFFCYCMQPDNFFYENLKDCKGKLNEEFLKVLCAYTTKDKKNANRFNSIVAEAMNGANADNVIPLIRDYNSLEKIGFELEGITKQVKYNVCNQLLSSIELFKMALDTFSLGGIRKFFEKSIFEAHGAFVDSSMLDSYMLGLYKLFLSDEELAKKGDVLYKHFMKRDMERGIFCTIVDDLCGGDNDLKVRFFIQVLKQEYKPFGVVWPYLKRYLQEVQSKPNFLEEFKDKLNDGEYAPMFYYAILNRRMELTTIGGIKWLTGILVENPALKRIVVTNYATDGIYNGFYNNVKAFGQKNPEEAQEAILDNVCSFLGVNDSKFEVLATYLNLMATKNFAEVKNLGNEELKLIYELVIEYKNEDLFRGLLSHFVELSQKGRIQPLELVSRYVEFVSGASTGELLKELVPSKDWDEMIVAIVKENRHEPFGVAWKDLQNFGLSIPKIEDFMQKYYSNEYKAYRRKEKLKSFVEGIKRLFVKKKKSDGASKNDEKKNKSKLKKNK